MYKDIPINKSIWFNFFENIKCVRFLTLTVRLRTIFTSRLFTTKVLEKYLVFRNKP